MITRKFYNSTAAFFFISAVFSYNYANEETHIYATYKSDTLLIITFKDLNNTKYKIVVDSTFDDLSCFLDDLVDFHTFLTISYHDR